MHHLLNISDAAFDAYTATHHNRLAGMRRLLNDVRKFPRLACGSIATEIDRAAADEEANEEEERQRLIILPVRGEDDICEHDSNGEA